MPEQKNANPNANAGSNLLDINKALLTDATPTYSEILACGHSNDIIVDLVADKGCTVAITPVLDVDDDTALGKPSDTGTLANGGGADRFDYADIRASRVKIVITKTEAGDCTSTIISVRGAA